MMYRKAIRMLIASVFLCFGLIAELNWWCPREIPLIKGYIDNHSVAINQNGKAIVFFGDKVFGSYNIHSNEWKFVKIEVDSGQMVLHPITGIENVRGSQEVGCKGQNIVLNEYDQGFVVFRIPEGPHEGKIGCLSYTEDNWGEVVLLSEEEGYMPVIAQSCGGAIAVWINKQEGSDHENCLMSSYYNDTNWKNQGFLSDYKSVDISYHQSALQIGITGVNDAIVVWKSYNEQDSERDQGLILVSYWDGIQEEWVSEEILAEQPRDKKEIHLSMNINGDAVLVWDGDRGIEGGFFNLSQYMLSNYYNIQKLPFSDWTKGLIAKGNELGSPKASIDEQGHGVVIWLNGYFGMNSAYFDNTNKSWSLIEQPVVARAVYAGAIQGGGNENYVLWIGEGEALQEIIVGSYFDNNSKTWKQLKVLNSVNDNSSLVDTVDAFSLGGQYFGMTVWYDFFKEKLFYSLLRAEREPELQEVKDKKHNRLYNKKTELAKKRADRKAHKTK